LDPRVQSQHNCIRVKIGSGLSKKQAKKYAPYVCERD